MHYHTCSYIVLHVPLTHYINMHILITFVSASATYTHCAESHTRLCQSRSLDNPVQSCTASPNIYPVCITILVTRIPPLPVPRLYSHATSVQTCMYTCRQAFCNHKGQHVSSVQYISVKDCCIANCCYPVAAYN